MDIGIFIEYNGQVVQIPVNPSTFNVKTSGNNSNSEIITLGEIVIPKKKKLSNISWECFFPYENWYPAIRTKNEFKSAQFYLDFINKIRDDCKPCHLTVTGIGFDDDAVIEKFDYYHQAGDHEDTYYSIELKRYQPYAVSVISKQDASGQLKNTTAVGTVQPQSKELPEPTQITIGCDVILNGPVHSDSYDSNPGETFKNYQCKVSLVNKKGSHPYHVTTPGGRWLGWASERSVALK